MTNLILIGIGLLIIWQGIELFKQHRKVKKELKKMKDEHIEWMNGDICLKKKNYPLLEIDDDFRYGIKDD